MQSLVNIEKLAEKYSSLCWKLSGHYLSYDLSNNINVEGETDHIEINVKATRMPDSEDNFRSRKIEHNEIQKTAGPSNYENPDHLMLRKFMELADSMGDTQNYEFLLYALSSIYPLEVFEQVNKCIKYSDFDEDTVKNIEVRYNQLEDNTVQIYYKDQPYAEICFEEYVWSLVFLDGKSFPNNDAKYTYENNMEETLILVIDKIEEYG